MDTALTSQSSPAHLSHPSSSLSPLSPGSELFPEFHKFLPTSLSLEGSHSSSLFSWLPLIPASLSTPSPTLMCSHHTVSLPTLITVHSVRQCVT